MTIELLWSAGCAHHEEALWLLRDVLRERAIFDEIDVIEVPDLTVAEQRAFPGTPTIRINGRDVDPAYEDTGAYKLECRPYPANPRANGIPDRRWIEAAVDEAIASV